MRKFMLVAAVILIAALQPNMVWADGGTGARIAQEAKKLIGKYPYMTDTTDCSQNPCTGYMVCTDVATTTTAKAGVPISKGYCACTEMRQAQAQLRFFKGENVSGGNDKLRRHFEPIGSPNPPEVGNILLYGDRHVAVVIEVIEDDGHIGLATVEANGGSKETNINRQAYEMERDGGWYFASGRNHQIISGWGVIDNAVSWGGIREWWEKIKEAWQIFQIVQGIWQSDSLPWIIAGFSLMVTLVTSILYLATKRRASPWTLAKAKFYNFAILAGVFVLLVGWLVGNRWLVCAGAFPTGTGFVYLWMRSRHRYQLRTGSRPVFPTWLGKPVVMWFDMFLLVSEVCLLAALVVNPALLEAKSPIELPSWPKWAVTPSGKPSLAETVRGVRRIAREQKVPEDLALAKLYAESALRHWDSEGKVLQSYAGARGIAQIYPPAHPNYDVKRDETDWEYNVQYGLMFYRALYDQYGDWRKTTWHYYSPAEADAGVAYVEKLLNSPPRDAKGNRLWEPQAAPWQNPARSLWDPESPRR